MIKREEKMKSDPKYATLYIHKECRDCLETLALFENEELKKQFRRKKVVFNVIEDKDGTYKKDVFMGYEFPLIRIEGIPPQHFDGKDKIKDFQSKYMEN